MMSTNLNYPRIDPTFFPNFSKQNLSEMSQNDQIWIFVICLTFLKSHNFLSDVAGIFPSMETL